MRDIEGRWAEAFQAFSERRAQSLETVKQKRDAELREFQEKWERPEALWPYEKASLTLLQLRKRQKSSAISNNFGEARALKSSVERMRNDESAEARKRAAEAMKHEYALLKERQQNELEIWKQNWDRKKAALELEMNAELEANGNLRKQLTTRIAGPKSSKKTQMTLPMAPAGHTELLSFKTRLQIADYRQQPDTVKLTVNASDVRALVRIGTKSPRKSRQPS
jgi:hypothetical protein